MSFWIFKCDPKKYRLADRILDPNKSITWWVTRYKKEIKRGDLVFLMETGRKRALRATFRIDQGPADMPELESEQAYWKERDTGTKCRVLGTLIDRFHLPISDLTTVDGLEDSCLFHGNQQGTNFKITDDEGNILLGLVKQLD